MWPQVSQTNQLSVHISGRNGGERIGYQPRRGDVERELVLEPHSFEGRKPRVNRRPDRKTHIARDMFLCPNNPEHPHNAAPVEIDATETLPPFPAPDRQRKI